MSKAIYRKLFEGAAANPNGFEKLVKKKGLLYNVNPGRGRRLRFVVPSAFRRKVLESCHESAEGGHLGERKTVAKV